MMLIQLNKIGGHLLHCHSQHHKYLLNKVTRCKYSIKCHFETLNLKPGCSNKEIRESFAKLSKECHPDSNKGGRSDSIRFQNIVEAYRALNKNIHPSSQFIVNPNDDASCFRTENAYPLPKERKCTRSKLWWKKQYKFVESYGYVPHYTINWVNILFIGTIAVFCVFAYRGIFRYYSHPTDKRALDSIDSKSAIPDAERNS